MINFFLFSAKKYCPVGWSDPFAEYCYLTVMEEMSWGSARSFCKDNQSTADLVAITSPYENNYVKRIAKNAQDRLWIGLSDSLAEGSWQWVDDTDISRFSGWAEGEPNGDRRENCGKDLEN